MTAPFFPMAIGGRRLAALSGRTFEVVNPKDGSTIASVARGDASDVEAAVAAAQAAFPAWAAASCETRCRVLSRAADLLSGRLPELVRIEVDQTGRPRREMAAQLARLPEWYGYFGALVRTHEDTVPPFSGPYLNYTRRVPLGVVGHLTPWNHPLLILTKKVAPALAAGNAIVAKPSEVAPLTALMLADVLEEAGLPPGTYNVVTGYGPEAGLALASHAGVRKLDLTGGTETGRAVAAIAGRNLTRCSAELGGKAAVILFQDVDVEAGVSAALFAAFIASGQTCVQGARLLVHRSIHDRVVSRLAGRADQIVIGDPQEERTEMGPLISARQLATVERYVALGLAEGATLAAGGARPSGAQLERGYYYKPTVFTGVKSSMRIAQEEIFGPVVCVMPFDEEDEAVDIANGTQFGLSASVWTRNVARAHRVAHRLQAGVVWINDHHRIDPASPWGGFKMSGVGRENGIAAFHEYTQIQNVVVNLSERPFDWYGKDGQAKRYS